jgi:hypothetical protein
LSSPAIEQKLAQLYAALSEMKITEKLASIKPTTTVSGGRTITSWDFTKIESPATAANRVSLLLHNIACLKDHLNAWCSKNGKPRTGDQLIDSNRDVAIIHDLWNLDKHAGLNRPSRSRLSPRLQQPAHTTLERQIASTEETLILAVSLSNGGQLQPVEGTNAKITATVIDDAGNTLGGLDSISLRAVAAWEAEFVKAGLKIVPPPERQKEYARLSGLLQAIGMRFRTELPIGATSLLLKLNDGSFLIEAYDRMGMKIGEISQAQASIGLRDALQKAFRGAVSPDHDGVVAILGDA